MHFMLFLMYISFRNSNATLMIYIYIYIYNFKYMIFVKTVTKIKKPNRRTVPLTSGQCLSYINVQSTSFLHLLKYELLTLINGI